MDMWNPMEEDYSNHSFNSYSRGPAAGLGGSDKKAGLLVTPKVYVSGIPQEMTNEGLGSLFSQVAEVVDAFIPSNQPKAEKGFAFGFVVLASVKDVERAIANLNGHRIKNFTLRVRWAHDKPNPNRDRGHGRASGDAQSVSGDHSPEPPSSASMNGGEKRRSYGSELVSHNSLGNGGPAGTPAAMGGMISAGCEECQRLWMAMITHVQQHHQSPSPSPSPTAAKPSSSSSSSSNYASLNGSLDSPDGAGNIRSPGGATQTKHQAGVPPSPVKPTASSGKATPPRGGGKAQQQPQSPQQIKSFQHNEKSSAFNKPGPKDQTPPRTTPIPVPRDQGVASPGRLVAGESKKADLKPCEACGKAGSKHCSKCHITYCSVDCQRGDWKRHKNKCKPNVPSVEQSEENSSTASHLMYKDLPHTKPQKDEMKVLMTHSMNPGSFWVQLADKKNISQYQEIIKLIDIQVQQSEPLKNPKPDLVCLAKYAEDNTWYRARVLKVNGKEKVTVCMVDFGNKEDVEVQYLRPATVELVAIPVQGVRCAVAGVEPRSKTGSWCAGSVTLMAQLVNQMLHAKFVGQNAGIYQVDLRQDENSVSVGKILVQQELAWSKNNKEAKSPRRAALMLSELEQPKLPIGGEPVPIVINDFISPANMVCQLLTKESLQVMEEFSKALNEALNSQGEHPGFTPVVGEVCAGKFSSDETWYRAHVKSQKPEGGYLVQYIDFGNSEVVKKTSLAPLPQKFHRFPQQSFVASFADLPPGAISQELCHSTRQRLAECTSGLFLASITGQDGTVILMNVADPTTGEDIGKAVGLVPSCVSFRVADVPWEGIPANADVKFLVTDVETLTRFTGLVNTAASSTNMMAINEGVAKGAMQPADPTFKPREGELCLAQFSGDEQWYRAAVKKVQENERFDVEYIDYGNCERVQAAVMRPIEEALAAVPRQGLKFSLNGLPDTNRAWPEEVVSSFKEMVGEGVKPIIMRLLRKTGDVAFVELEDPSTELNISEEIVNQAKEALGIEEPAPSGPSSLKSNPTQPQSSTTSRQPSRTPTNNPHSLGGTPSKGDTPSQQAQSASSPATVLSPEKIKSLEEQLAMLSAQLQEAKGASA